MNLSHLLTLSALLLSLSSCMTGFRADSLNDLRMELESLQKDPTTSNFAPDYLRKAEKSLIDAVNQWNAGNHEEAAKLADYTKKEIEIAKKSASEEAALGLSATQWKQRHFLQQQREELRSRKN